jgi:hypothetical protein
VQHKPIRSPSRRSLYESTSAPRHPKRPPERPTLRHPGVPDNERHLPCEDVQDAKPGQEAVGWHAQRPRHDRFSLTKRPLQETVQVAGPHARRKDEAGRSPRAGRDPLLASGFASTRTPTKAIVRCPPRSVRPPRPRGRQRTRPRRGGGQGECDRLRKRAFARFAGAPIDQR